MAEKKKVKKVSAAFENKKEVVAEIRESLKNAKCTVFVDYKKLTVKEATELRVKCRTADVKYKVYKNNLVRLALNDLGITELDDKLTGQLAVAFSNADEVTGVKIIAGQDFKDKMAFKFGLLGKSILSAEDVQKLRDLPSKDQLIAQIMGLIQSGARNIATVIQAVPRNLAMVINAKASA